MDLSSVSVQGRGELQRLETQFEFINKKHSDDESSKNELAKLYRSALEVATKERLAAPVDLLNRRPLEQAQVERLRAVAIVQAYAPGLSAAGRALERPIDLTRTVAEAGQQKQSKESPSRAPAGLGWAGIEGVLERLSGKRGFGGLEREPDKGSERVAEAKAEKGGDGLVAPSKESPKTYPTDRQIVGVLSDFEKEARKADMVRRAVNSINEPNLDNTEALAKVISQARNWVADHVNFTARPRVVSLQKQVQSHGQEIVSFVNKGEPVARSATRGAGVKEYVSEIEHSQVRRERELVNKQNVLRSVEQRLHLELERESVRTIHRLSPDLHQFGVEVAKAKHGSHDHEREKGKKRGQEREPGYSHQSSSKNGGV